MSGERLRCLHVASGDGWGGAEVSATHLIVELSRREEVAVEVVLLNDGLMAQRLREAGVPLQLLCERKSGFGELSRQLDDLIAKRQPQVIHSHRYKEHLLCARAAQRRNLFHLRSAHGRPPALRFDGRLHGVGPLLDRLVAMWLGADWLAVSSDLASEVGGVRQRVHVVPNGIPAAAPESRRTTLEALLQRPLERSWVVGFVGRFEPVKRPDRMVRLFERLPETIADRSVIGCMLGDGPLWDQTAKAVEQFGLSDRLLLAGRRDDAEALIGSLDLLIIPSDHEGHPMVLLEAMRAGVPVIASRVGGLVEALGEDCPWLVPAGNDTATVDAVKALLAGADLREGWSAELKQLFAQSGSIGVSADRVLEIYRGAVG